MKTLNKKRAQNIMFLALGIIAIIAGMLIVTDWQTGLTIFAAAPFIVKLGTKEFELNENEQKLYEAITGYIDQQNKGFISETKMKELVTESLKEHNVDLANNAEFKELKEALAAQGLSIKSLKEVTNPEKMTFTKEFAAAFEANKEALIEAAKGGKTVKFTLKTAATTITSANMATGVNPGYRESLVEGTAPNECDTISLVSVMNGGPGSNPLSWTELVKLNGGAAGVAESGTKALMDNSWTQTEANARTIAVMAVVSKRAVNNRAQLEQEVRGELLIDLRNELNRQIIAGADNTSEIKGISAIYASAYAADIVVGATANYWDVLLTAYKQSRKLFKGSRPNAILISLGASVDMDLVKSTDGVYLFPAFMIRQDKSLKGIPIIECDDIGDGEFLIGDFKRYLFNYTQDVTIEVGWMGDDFGVNQFRIRAELEGMGRVKAHRNNFVKGTFSTAITDLTS